MAVLGSTSCLLAKVRSSISDCAVSGNPISFVDLDGLRGRGGSNAHLRPGPTVSAFGCAFFGCATGGPQDSDTQVSLELSVGGGIEICDGAPPPSESSSNSQQCKATDKVQPPGVPVPKRFGGLFLGPSVKRNGRFCLRIGPHISVPATPSLDIGGMRDR